MIWLTWRQFRAQAITAAAALAVFAIVLAATEPHLSSLYDSSGLPPATAIPARDWPARSCRTCPPGEVSSSPRPVPT